MMLDSGGNRDSGIESVKLVHGRGKEPVLIICYHVQPL
jgi:hypothetical protein